MSLDTLAAASWVKLALDGPLAQFHTKFWGTSMKDERDAWSKADGQGALNELEMDVDDDGEADILPGCFLSCWHRGIHPTIYLGKTFWQVYAARRCASEKRPFLWLHDDKYTLFVEVGAYELPADWGLTDFLPSSRVWAFVDLETSPTEKRWRRLHKTTSSYLFIMNPWSIGEIKRAASLYDLLEEEVLQKYDRLGPMPRLCIEYDVSELETHETKLETALANLTTTTFEKLIPESRTLVMNETSRSLCLLSREEDRFHKPVLAPVSLYVKTRFANQFHKEELKEKIRLYRHFGKAPHSRSVAGVFFEAAVKSHLTTEISLTLHPMVKRECNGPTMKLPQWYSSHIPLSDPELEQLRVQAVEEDLSVTPTQTIEYLESELDTILSDVFYVPKRSNQVAIDSFILSNGKLYFFQFTIAKNHPMFACTPL
ncbi:hypothetical protein BU17DRAFT_66773 [Hysterangium stoloniferum]|nr:hypothetical protein BU17DRAFT_66773 [Hysterangium stoloniferum]